MKINVFNLISENGFPKLNVIKTVDYDIVLGIYDIIDVINQALDLKKLYLEHIIIFSYDNQGKITGIFIAGLGNNEESRIYFKNIFTYLFMSNSKSYYIFHNHSSENLSPSNEDKNLLNQLQGINNMFGLELLDSGIITNKGFYLMNEEREYLYD